MAPVTWHLGVYKVHIRVCDATCSVSSPASTRPSSWSESSGGGRGGSAASSRWHSVTVMALLALVLVRLGTRMCRCAAWGVRRAARAAGGGGSANGARADADAAGCSRRAARPPLTSFSDQRLQSFLGFPLLSLFLSYISPPMLISLEF